MQVTELLIDEFQADLRIENLNNRTFAIVFAVSKDENRNNALEEKFSKECLEMFTEQENLIKKRSIRKTAITYLNPGWLGDYNNEKLIGEIFRWVIWVWWWNKNDPEYYFLTEK